MAQKSGFFNALQVAGAYDRTYSADDYCDNLAVVIGNGVLRSTGDDLKVTASGLNLSVAAGRGWINGHYYYNDSVYSLPAVVPPTGGSRIDRVILRLNLALETRSVSLQYLTGTAGTSPVPPDITRSGDIYDLVLANITVAANATTCSVEDTRGDATLCGWVYSTSGDDSFFTSLDNSFNTWFLGVRDELSSVTLFKRYTWEQTLATATNTVQFNIPQYDSTTDFFDVYVNGILSDDYTASGNVLTFSSQLTAGTEVMVYSYKSLDGTGILTVADEITALQNQYATISGASQYIYKCTGLNDNISLSEIAQAFISGSYTPGSVTAAANAFLTALGGNTFLANFPSDGQITVSVVGTLGATTPFAGNGTAQSRYRWFSLGASGTSDKRIIFDFEKCGKIGIACSGSSKNIIFYGTDLNIKNANVLATGASAGTDIYMCIGSSNYGLMNFEGCRFKVVTTGLAIIAENGSFRDCVLHVKSSGSNAYCIDAKAPSLVRLNGGTMYAYTGLASAVSAITNVEASETTSAINAVNVSCPTQEQSGFTQYYLCVAKAGMTQFIGATTILTPNGNASYYKLVNQIQRSKR